MRGGRTRYRGLLNLFLPRLALGRLSSLLRGGCLLRRSSEAFGHDQFSAASSRTEYRELIHERAHEENAAAGRLQQVLLRQWIGDVGEVEATALVEDADDKLVVTTRARQDNFLIALLAVAVTNRVDDAFAHREANLLTVVLAESTRLSGAQTDLFGPIDAFKQRL